MGYELKNGQGSFFRVEEKKTPGSPDYEGRLQLEDREWRVAGWIKVTGAGRKWLSLKVEPPRQAEPVRAPAGNAGQPDDDVPF